MEACRVNQLSCAHARARREVDVAVSFSRLRFGANAGAGDRSACLRRALSPTFPAGEMVFGDGAVGGAE